MPMPEEGINLRRYQKDTIFAQDGGFKVAEFQAVSLVIDVDNPLPSLLKTTQTPRIEERTQALPGSATQKNAITQALPATMLPEAFDDNMVGNLSSPAKKLNLRDFDWCKPFIIEEDVMDDKRLNAELEKVGHKCHLRYKHFRTCMRKLDFDHSGVVDLQELTNY